MTRAAGRVRPLVLAAVLPVLLAGCGGDEEPRVDVSDPKSACRTEGTIESDPQPTIEQAVAPYREPGHRLRISERHSDTATVQLKAGNAGPEPVSVTLVRTEEGWTATSVQRC